MTERNCVNCNAPFEVKAHNAIYCGAECRKEVTNRKVLEKYHKSIERRNSERVCETDGCNTVLSRYNEKDICEPCQTEGLINRMTDWGWDEEALREDWSF